MTETNYRSQVSHSQSPEPGTMWVEKDTGQTFEVTGHKVGLGGIIVIGIRPSGRRGRIALPGLLDRYWPVRS